MANMLALSIQQPWAHLILFHGKDIENRVWSTTVRRRVLIHAAKGFKQADLEEFEKRYGYAEVQKLQFGGLVGEVDIVDCVTKHDSDWFEGPYGFLLRNPKPIEFVPCIGRLKFWTVDPDKLRVGK